RRRSLTLAHDGLERLERGDRADHRIAALEVDLLARELQIAVAAERFLLAHARDEFAQVLRQRFVERADGVVVDGHGRDARSRISADELELRGEAGPIRLRRARRPLQIYEVLQ